MKEYTVVVPITGYVTVYVEAKDEESAKSAARKKLESLRMEMTGSEADAVEVGHWSSHERVVRGNVSYAVKNEIEVSE